MRSGTTGRIAGALYVVVILTGMFSLVYVPGQLQLTGTPEVAAQSIASHETLYRLGVLSWLLNCVAFLLLPLAFYRLLQGVSRTPAGVMVAFALMSIPISLAAAGYELQVLSLVGGRPPLSAISAESRQELVLQALTAVDGCEFVAQLFWGLWLLPLGWLIWKSGVVPGVFGVLLVLGGVGYLVQEVGGVLSNTFGQTPLSQFATLPAAAGEIGLGFWLLLRGIRERSVGSA